MHSDRMAWHAPVPLALFILQTPQPPLVETRASCRRIISLYCALTKGNCTVRRFVHFYPHLARCPAFHFLLISSTVSISELTDHYRYYYATWKSTRRWNTVVLVFLLYTMTLTPGRRRNHTALSNRIAYQGAKVETTLPEKASPPMNPG
jgi:hypothetical protein